MIRVKPYVLLKKVVSYLYLKYYKIDTCFGYVTLNGFPKIVKHKDAKITIGNGVTLNSSIDSNFAGINHRVILAAPTANSVIKIGDGVGVSGSTVVAVTQITLESKAGLGVNSCIYDTDFHPIGYLDRVNQKHIEDALAKPIVVGEGSLIGASVIVLKGITIGKFSVIGAGSVVTKDVPDNVLVAGNPARIIRCLV
jgi:acetyltransferase-like isoleucine patch superfamily enzyme